MSNPTTYGRQLLSPANVYDITEQAALFCDIDPALARNIAFQARALVLAKWRKPDVPDVTGWMPKWPDFSQAKEKWRYITATEMLMRCGVKSPTRAQAQQFGIWCRSHGDIESYRSNGAKKLRLPTAFVEPDIL